MQQDDVECGAFSQEEDVSAVTLGVGELSDCEAQLCQALDKHWLHQEEKRVGINFLEFCNNFSS